MSNSVAMARTSDRRSSLLADLERAVGSANEAGGGVIALIGKAGCGKTLLARQFALENNRARYIDGQSPNGGPAVAEALSGTPLLDEVWQFVEVAQAVQTFCRVERGVVVAIATSEAEVAALFPKIVLTTVHVPHWNEKKLPPTVEDAIASNDKHVNDSAPIRRASNSGIIRFRGPKGQAWTGFGRTPNWLSELEANGHSREQYRVDDTPLKRRSRGAR